MKKERESKEKIYFDSNSFFMITFVEEAPIYRLKMIKRRVTKAARNRPDVAVAMMVKGSNVIFLG